MTKLQKLILSIVEDSATLWSSQALAKKAGADLFQVYTALASLVKAGRIYVTPFDSYCSRAKYGEYIAKNPPKSTGGDFDTWGYKDEVYAAAEALAETLAAGLVPYKEGNAVKVYQVFGEMIPVVAIEAAKKSKALLSAALDMKAPPVVGLIARFARSRDYSMADVYDAYTERLSIMTEEREETREIELAALAAVFYGVRFEGVPLKAVIPPPQPDEHTEQ